MGENVNTANKSTKNLFDIGKEDGTEITTEKSMFMSDHHNARTKS